MSNPKNPPSGYRHENHRKPMNRRDLLSQGFISFGAYLAMPSMLSLFASQARGEDALVCKAASGGARMVPLIILDLAGGANIAGSNVIVGDRGGQRSYLAAGSYSTIGLTAEQEPGKLDQKDLAFSEFGLAFHPASKMLAGMRQTCPTATTRAGVDGALFCTSSGDDTRSNPHNPLYWIAKAGLTGELVSLVGTSDGTSGGNAAAPANSIDPSKQPSRITRADDALGLVDPGRLATLIKGINGNNQANALADVQKVLAATKTMSESRLKMFQAKDMPSQIQDLVRCGYINSSDFLSRFQPTALDPRLDAAFTTAFPSLVTGGVATALANESQAKAVARHQSAATIVKLVLDGYAGAGVLQMGGYDYHGQGRATQDTQDLEAGRMIGRILELAAAKKSPIMIYVYTDGGVASGNAGAVNGILPFTSDSGERSSAFALVYKPEGRVEIRDGRRQIGAFKNGGSVDGTFNRISNSVPDLTKAVVANYLALNGLDTAANLEKVVGDNPFGADLEKYLAFGKVV